MYGMKKIIALHNAVRDKAANPDFEYKDEQKPGSFTGFNTIPDGLDLGIPDARGAFNPAFNGQTPTPLFEASTAALRNTLQGLAQKARAGDASAALHYDAFYQTLQEQQSIYSIATGYGLNDRNATGIMTHLNKVASRDTMGKVAPQFQSDYAHYLSSIVKDRDTNVEKLLPGEQMLDDAFNMSFTMALDRASNRNPSAGSLASTLRQNAGVYSGFGLTLKKALASWENQNGLRTDSARAEIMARAAEYAAKCATNPALQSMLYSNPNKIIEAAATKLGYHGGVWDPTVSPLDTYDAAVNLIPSRIQYTDPEADVAMGLHGVGEDGQASPLFTAIQDALEKHYGRNVARGKPDVFADDTSGQFKAELLANLRAIAPGAAINNPEYSDMLNDVANDVIEMSRGGGTINISKILRRYHTNDFINLQANGAYRPKETPVDLKVLNDFSDDIVRQLHENRDTFARNYGFGARKPEYTTDGISRSIDAMFMSRPEVAKFAGEHPELYDKFKYIAVNYVRNLNRETDDLTTADTSLVQQGLRDRIAVLGLVADLESRDKSLKKALASWKGPKLSGEGATRSSQTRGRTDADLRNIYNGLDGILRQWADANGELRADADGKDRYDLDYVQGLYEGMTKAMGLGAADTGIASSVYEGSEKDLSKSGVAGIIAYAKNKADSAEDIRYSQKILRTEMTNKPGRAKALADWSDAALSSVTNPVRTQNATAALKYYINANCSTIAKDSKLESLVVSMYLPMMLKLQRGIRNQNPERSLGIEWSDPLIFNDKVKDAASSMYARIKEMDRAMAYQQLMRRQEDAEMTSRGRAAGAEQ